MAATDETAHRTLGPAGDTRKVRDPLDPEYKNQREREFRQALAEARAPISDDPVGELVPLAEQYAAEDFDRWLFRVPRSAPESVYQLMREERFERLAEVVGVETVERAIEDAFLRERRGFAEHVRGLVDGETIEQFVSNWDDESARKIFAAYDHLKERDEAADEQLLSVDTSDC